MHIRDEHIAEAVARQGGYEVVDREKKWELICNGLGMRKSQAEETRKRYEDMLKTSAELDEREEEDEEEEYEVDEILDSRTDDKGNVEYLVKWKYENDNGEDDDGDEEDKTTWEPREHLACPELLEAFEEAKKERQKQRASAAGAPEEGLAAAAPADAASAEAGGTDATGAANSATATNSEEPPAKKQKAQPGYGRFERILRMCRPQEGKPMIFEVLCLDGTKTLIPSTVLRTEAPLALVDFYESKLIFES